MQNPNLNNDLTLLVFKENLSSRSFQIPLSWFRRFGILLTVLILTTAVSSGWAIRNALRIHNARKDLIRDLEEEREKTRRLEKQVDALTPAVDKQNSSTQTSAPPPPTQVTELGPLFTVFAQDTGKPLTNLKDSTLIIQNLKVKTGNKNLSVHFDLHYNREDGGNQKGRVFLLARGPSVLLTYPKNLLEPVGSSKFLNLDQGEHFSVSRQRAVDATFDLSSGKENIQSLELIIIADETHSLLIHQALPLKEQEVENKAPAQPSPNPSGN